jgi:hypothetical protein
VTRSRWLAVPPLLLLATMTSGWSDRTESSGPIIMGKSALGSGCSQQPLAWKRGRASGIPVRFIEGGKCTVNVYVQNTSGESVTLLAASTPGAPNGYLRRVSTKFVLEPRSVCVVTGGNEGPCPPWGPGELQMRDSVTLPPTAEAVIKLDYRFVDCHAARRPALRTAELLELVYRPGPYAIAHQVLPLGPFRLLVRKLTLADCPPRSS